MPTGSNNTPTPEESPSGLNIPIPEEPEEPFGTDPEAASEDQLTASGDYGRATQRDHYLRNRNLADAIASTGRMFLFVIQTGILVIGLALVVHYVFPPSWLWIPIDRIEKLESFLTGGVITIVFIVIREYLKPRT